MQGSICNKAGLQTHVEKVWNSHHTLKLEVPDTGRASCHRGGGKSRPFPFPNGWQLPDCPYSAEQELSHVSAAGLGQAGHWPWDMPRRWRGLVQPSQVHKDIMAHIQCSLLQGGGSLPPSSSSCSKFFWVLLACVFWNIYLYVFIWIIYSCTPAVWSFCITSDSAANSLTRWWTRPWHRGLFLP